MHLFGGPVDPHALAEAAAAPAAHRVARTDDLEIRLNTLEAELHQLKEQFAAFKRQFES